MGDLLHFKAKVCQTAAGVLIHENRVLLVKHKRLGVWLNPGGHIEDQELPHQAAEREFWEETGVKVKAIDPNSGWWQDHSEYQHLPNPFATNIHWYIKDNYQRRLKKLPLLEKRDCEQHHCFLYLMAPLGSLDFTQNVRETTGIAWFTESEIKAIETLENIRLEIYQAFAITRNKSYAK